MKKSLFIFAFISLSLSFLQAQTPVVKTLSVIPGGLYKALPFSERTTITHLILTGSIDAQDFKTMRDAMTNLSIVDLSRVTISAYSGSEGTMNSKASFKANTIPQNAFFNDKNSSGKKTLTTVILPENLEGIGAKAFYACYAYKKVIIPATVTNIGTEAFSNCKTMISVTALNPTPITDLGKGVFFAVDPGACILSVPAESIIVYKSAKQWGDFINIKQISEEVAQ